MARVPPKVKLCTSTADCRELQTARHAIGIVHWVLDAPTDQYNYSLCVGSACGPPAQLNHAELMWHQCVGSSETVNTTAAAGNGLRCAPGGVLRLFGKGLAFTGSRCATYSPYVHSEGQQQNTTTLAYLRLTLDDSASSTGAPIELTSTTASCYDATFTLPASLAPGSYTLEVKSNLPSATWQVARDPDQRTLPVAEHRTHQCDSGGKTFTARSATSLKQALASAAARNGGATVVVEGTITLGIADMLTVANCTVLQGADGERTGGEEHESTARLQWVARGDALGMDCGMRNTYLIGVAGEAITVQDLAILAVGLRGCTGIVGAQQSSGLTLRNLNITAFASMHTQAVFAPPISLRSATNFLIEGSTFLHCGNNTPGDAHAGVNTPILDIAVSNNGVIRNNLWMVGLSGWHIDTSVHIIMESNTFTGYFDNDVNRPLPNFDGSFWFSSYSQGPFPGAGRFFYGNTTQNERPHSKPQLGGGESFTLDGGNSGGYYGRIDKIAPAPDSSTFLLEGTPCWKTAWGSYRIENCTLPDAPGKTGHAVQIIAGPSKGQWRRVIGVTGAKGRTIELDAPFEPAPTLNSVLQIGQMRGQLLVVGNHFVKGGSMQLYAACYDCVVAENRFDDFGFANWGRNPHGVGWQPNLNNVMLDNIMNTGLGSMSVRGCGVSCSASFGSAADIDGNKYSANSVTPCVSSLGECSGNSTSLLGRDCAPFLKDPTNVGSYAGATNLQLAWRRNTMNAVEFLNGVVQMSHGIPLVDGGVIEGNHAVGNKPITVNGLNVTTNILIR